VQIGHSGQSPSSIVSSVEASSPATALMSVAITGTGTIETGPVSATNLANGMIYASPQVQFYSAAGIQVGDKMAITGTFSQVTQNTYMIQAVTPTSLDFVSTNAIPIEGPLTYIPSTIQFYTDAQRFVYIEVDQPAAVQFNADTSFNTMLNPIAQNIPGGNCLPQINPQEEMVGYLHKWGNSYKCVVVNTSVNSLKVKFFLGE
jgi:hypothetical protein